MKPSSLVWCLPLFILGTGCGQGAARADADGPGSDDGDGAPFDAGADGDSDTDADSDGDADGDTDADTDADSDSDADADADSDTDTRSADADGGNDSTDPCFDDAEADVDGDGHRSPQCGGADCDDGRADTFPGAADHVGDEVDQSCDGMDGMDSDRDRYASADSGGDDCDDLDATVRPGSVDRNLSTERVARGGGLPVDLALSAGVVPVPHLCFTGDWEGIEVRYATRVDGEWIVETIEEAASSAGACTIAVARSDAPRVAYELTTIGLYGERNSDLRVASRSGGGWDLATVTSESGVGFAPALVLDADGRSHLAYGGPTSREISWATDVSGAWVAEAVSHGSRPSVAFDPSGRIHLVYRRFEGGVQHSVRTAEGWVEDAVGAPTEGETCELAFAPSGSSHLVYGATVGFAEEAEQHLFYASDADGGWGTETIEEGGDADAASISVDADGVAHVGYYLDGFLYHATNERGGWSSERVGTGVGSIVVDARGRLHAAYYDTFVNEVSYVRVVPDGVDQNCDGVDGTDADSDGFASRATGGDDCSDYLPQRFPGAPDRAGDEIDMDCDGLDG